MFYFTGVIFLCLPYTIVSGQSKKGYVLYLEQKAIREYDEKNYAYAARNLEHLLNLTKGKMGMNLYLKLADAYWKNRQIKNAAEIYEQIRKKQMGELSPEVKSRIADIFAMQQQYDSATFILNQIKGFEKKKKGFQESDQFLIDSLDYEITYPSLNTIAAEYLPVCLGKILFITTNRTYSARRRYVDKWTGGVFSKIQFTESFEELPTSIITQKMKKGDISYFPNSRHNINKNVAPQYPGADVELLTQPLTRWPRYFATEGFFQDVALIPQNPFHVGNLSFYRQKQNPDILQVLFVGTTNHKDSLKRYLRNPKVELPLKLYTGDILSNILIPGVPQNDKGYKSNEDILITNIQGMAMKEFDGSIQNATISNDGEWLVFSGKSINEHHLDLFYAQRINDTLWDTPRPFGANINSNGNEVFPSFRTDGYLYFSSDGLPGLGALDIFRISFMENFQTSFTITPEHLTYPINSAFDDYGITFFATDGNDVYSDEDKYQGFFTTTRSGSDDIMHFKYEPFRIEICGDISLSTQTKSEIPGENVKVVLFYVDASGKKIRVDSTISDINGKYCVTAKPNRNYEFIFSKSGYNSSKLTTYPKIVNKLVQRRFAQPLIKLPVINVDSNSRSVSIPIQQIDSTNKYSYNKSIISKEFIIHHEFKRTIIKDEQLAIFREMILFITANQKKIKSIKIFSASDCYGSSDFGQYISDLRANHIARLIKRATRVRVDTVEGIGQTQPVIPCETNTVISSEQQLINRYSRIIIEYTPFE